MDQKTETPIKYLFQFVGEEKGKMKISVILATLGELFGMLPFLAAAILANQVYAGTATTNSALLWTGGAALGIVMRTYLCTKSSSISHKIAFTILRNIRRTIASKMRRVPMGTMLETPSGVYKTLLVDNVGKLEDSIAHVIPETPSQVAAMASCLILIFVLDWRMGLASLITLPLTVPFVFGMMHGYEEKMKTYLRSGNEMNAALVEYVGGIQVIKAFGRTGASFGTFSDAVTFFHDSTLVETMKKIFMNSKIKGRILADRSRNNETKQRLIQAANAKKEQVLSALGTFEDGLTEEMAEKSRETFGNNVITHGKKDSVWKRIWAAFVNPFTSILFLLTVVSVFNQR